MPSQDLDGIGISIALMYSTGASFCVDNVIEDGRISPASDAEKAARDIIKHVIDTGHRCHGHCEAFFGHRCMNSCELRHTKAMHNTSSKYSVQHLQVNKTERIGERLRWSSNY